MVTWRTLCTFGRNVLAVEIELTIDVSGHFHIGTGSGRGRATDAVVVTDENGAPFIPGSTIKGLCKWQACRIIDAYPGFGPNPEKAVKSESPLIGPAFEIFGGGSDRQYAEDRVWFDHATASSVIPMGRSGRSTRDRLTGRTRDKQLFFYENAGPSRFKTTLRCEDDLSPAALLLWMLSLRRIDAIGGQRRRGKGQCQCSVKIVDPGSAAELAALKNVELPGSGANREQQNAFRRFALPLLEAAQTNKPLPLNVPTKKDPTSDKGSIQRSQNVCWLVFATAKTSITLGHEQAADNTIGSEDFISGTALRGALAWRSIRAGLSPESDLFQAIFVHERVQFGPLYPAPHGWSTGGTFPMPVPMSFFTCKRFPGAKGNPLVATDGLADGMWHPCQQCDQCGVPMVPADGYLQVMGYSEEASLQLGRPEMHVSARTAIDEHTQRGAEGQLFVLQSVPAGTRLAGYLWGEQELLKRVFGDLLNQRTTLRVGKAKSRGQGAIEVHVKAADSDANQKYPCLLPKHPSDDEAVFSNNNDFLFLTLYSDLIAIDEYLRPITTLTAARLWQLLGGQSDDVPFELEVGFVGTRRIGGYLGVVGLPRSPDIAIRAGATWRLRWREGLSPTDRSTAWQALLKAQTDGLGLRRGEGYGRVIVNLPLHAARWDKMQWESQQVDMDGTSFPSWESPTPAKADRRSQLVLLGSPADDFAPAYRRLFAHLAQADNPLRAVQTLLDDPLHRSGKTFNLADQLKKLVDETRGLNLKLMEDNKCVANKSANDPEIVARFKQALKKFSGEDLDHV